jgi:DNA mismatch repair protein MutS
VKRAREILASIENDRPVARAEKKTDADSFDLFSGIVSSKENEVADSIRKADINTLTPIEAMNLLFELKKKLSD